MTDDRNISLKTFLHYFVDQQREDKKFCFVLGAGASKPSGIPTGGELAKVWIKEIKDRFDDNDFDSWLEEEGITLENLAKDYCKIYNKRFSIYEADGFYYLERVMEGVDPSIGYSILAQILAGGEHRVVVTTNFDRLIEDAVSIYTNKRTLVIGHESLADFITPNVRAFKDMPVVIKIHRDLFFSPFNNIAGTSSLAVPLSKNLEVLFRYFTPLVIGYGGNDGSLMGFLESLDEIRGGIFWFYRESDGEPTERIQKLVKNLGGRLVSISGFDELMIQLGDKLKLEKLDEKIIDVAKSRSEAYRNQIECMIQVKKDDKDTKNALERIFKPT